MMPMGAMAGSAVPVAQVRIISQRMDSITATPSDLTSTTTAPQNTNKKWSKCQGPS